MKKTLFISAILLTAMLGCKTQNENTMGGNTDFKWQIDRFDDIKILRYQVPDFDSLSLDQKKLVYYLSEAALWGRDIFFDQNFKYNLQIRETLEQIYKEYKGDKSSNDYTAFEKYLKKVWFANGIHHHYSGEKFIPEFSREFFIEQASKSDLLKNDKELLSELTEVIFNDTLYPQSINQQQGVDMIVTSASNYYDGVTQAEAEAFYNEMAEKGDKKEPISYGLNSRLVKRDGKIYEEVYHVGGKYSKEIEQIVYWLKKASDVAENANQKATIDKLISYYETGDLKTFDLYNIDWLKDTDSKVDFVNGFIEVYGDPLGYKASWESVVNFKNIEATKRTELISSAAQWFEDNSPVEDKYKKKEVKGVSAKVITVAMLGGDCYPATPIGINLPNADWIRKEHGSKSVTIQNITDAYAAASIDDGFKQEFTLKEEDMELAKKYGSLAGNLHTDLHECLGHGSGQLAEGIKGDELKNYGSPLEEARADLFALYYLGDTKLVDLGIVPNMDVMKVAYYNSIFNGMMGQLTRIQPGKDIVQAHMRDRQLIATWCYEKGKSENVIELVKNNNKTYVVINDYQKLRGLFGELLKEVQRIKSEGDFEAGKALIENYGVKVNQEIHKEVLERFEALNIAPYSGFVNPELKPIEKDGEIVDIVISYPDNYIDQMFEYSTNYSL